MVRYSYQAEEQVNRLSDRERRDLDRVLEGGAKPEQTRKAEGSEKFVSRFGENKRVVWEQADRGDVVVLAVVSR